MEDVSPMRFDYHALPARVLFGAGRRRETPEVARQLGCTRPLIISTPEQKDLADAIASLFSEAQVHVFSEAAMHTPWNVTSRALAVAQGTGADSLIAVGGGSAIGLAKALALRTGLPQIALPTTYAGSEVTPIYGLTEGGVKRTGKDPRVLPRTVIYDPELTLGLPYALSVTSGINAIAHAAEGLYSKDGNPIMDLIAAEGIRAVAAALPALRAHPRDLEARSQALYGAWLCGTVLGNVGMALHHKLCHTLGGTFNLPHAEVHTVILPHAIAYNASAAPVAMTRIARALETSTAAPGLYDLARAQGAPYALRDIGMRAEDLDRASDLAVANPYWNPRPIERSLIRDLLQRAYEGARPQ